MHTENLRSRLQEAVHPVAAVVGVVLDSRRWEHRQEEVLQKPVTLMLAVAQSQSHWSLEARHGSILTPITR